MITRRIQVKVMAVAAVMMIMSTFAAMAHDNDRKPSDKERAAWNREMRQAKAEFISRELELDDRTKAQFQTLYENMDKEVESLGEQTRKMNHEIREKGAKATDLELEKAAEARFELKGRENAIEMKYYEEFKKVLTPAQLFKIKDSERKFNRQLMKEHRKATGQKK